MSIKRLLDKTPRWIFTVIVVAAVLYLTLMPQPLPDNDIPWFEGMDKLVHGIMMFGVMLCLSFDYFRICHKKQDRIPVGTLSVFLIITIAFGGLIELLQDWMDMGRGKDMKDFEADTIGALVAYVIVLLNWHRLKRWFLKH